MHPPPSAPRPEVEVFGPIGDYLGFLFRSVGRHKVLAIGVVLAASALGVLAARVMPMKYQVQATTLALRNGGANRDWDAPVSAAREVVIRRQNLVALCQRTDFVRRYRESRAPVVRARDWVFKAVLGRDRTDEQLLEDLVNSLENQLWVVSTPEGTVTIGFTWSDPDIAYDMVEAAMESFLEARNSAELGAMGESIAILKGHEARLQKEVAVAIERLEAKEKALRIRMTPARIPLTRGGPRPDEETVRLEAVLAARRRTLADLEAFRQRRLTELQLSLSEQLTVFAPQHPNVVSTRRSIESLATSSPQAAALAAEVAQLEQQLGRRASPGQEAAQAAVTSELDMAAIRSRMAENRDPRLEVEQGQLDTLLRRHAGLIDRIETARIELDTVQANFQQRYAVITPAKRPRGPLKPYGLFYVLGGVLGGMMLAVAACAGTDLRGGRVVERWQVEQSLGLPVLTEVRR
jgi:uncharacterized protein involved in exopolysaccharide biosynthesis